MRDDRDQHSKPGQTVTQRVEAEGTMQALRCELAAYVAGQTSVGQANTALDTWRSGTARSEREGPVSTVR